MRNKSKEYLIPFIHKYAFDVFIIFGQLYTIDHSNSSGERGHDIYGISRILYPKVGGNPYMYMRLVERFRKAVRL